MGGELDATNVYDKLFNVFTPIGLDHLGVLGNNIEEISTTKFKALGYEAQALLSDNMDKRSVEIVRQIAKEKRARVKFASEILNESDKEAIAEYALKFSLPEFLASNLTLAGAASKALLGKFEIDDLEELNLQGRCEKVASNVWVDVGHNELAALAIAKKFRGKKLTLIYNSFADKDFKAVLKALKPIIKDVLIYEYESLERALATNEIKQVLDDMGVVYSDFKGLKFTDSQKSKEKYLAFGSFFLVEAFLRQFDAS